MAMSRSVALLYVRGQRGNGYFGSVQIALQVHVLIILQGEAGTDTASEVNRHANSSNEFNRSQAHLDPVYFSHSQGQSELQEVCHYLRVSL